MHHTTLKNVRFSHIVAFKGKLILVLFLLFPIIHGFMYAQDLHARLPQKEWDALRAFYDSTNGDNWINNTYPDCCFDWWTEDIPVDDWVGIYVDPNKGGEYGETNVIRLIFTGDAGGNLTGSIPPEIGDFSELEELLIYNNNLTGSIPSEIGNLTNLKKLVLYRNNLTGSIPPEIGNLTNLEELILYNNDLTGSIAPEIGDLTNLEVLNLNGLPITGSIPPEIGNLTNLRGLHLATTNISGPIPSQLGNLTNLEELILNKFVYSGNEGSQLSGGLPRELGNLSNLKRLCLTGNNITGSIPSELANLSSLEELSLASNELSGSIPSQLENLTKLEILSLSSNNLSGSIPPELGNLGALEKLNLSWNYLTGSIPSELGNLSNLKELLLNRNGLTGPIPFELGNLKELVRLVLSSNLLSGDLPFFIIEYVSNPSNGLDLQFNCLNGYPPEVLEAYNSYCECNLVSSQNMPPGNPWGATVDIRGNEENSVEVSWDTSINFVEGEGGYQVYYDPVESSEDEVMTLRDHEEVDSIADSASDFFYYGMTSSKEEASLIVSNLEPGAKYNFRIDTVTWANENLPDDLVIEGQTTSGIAGTYSRAFIPVWKQKKGNFTGVVVSNFGKKDFTVELRAQDSNGSLEPLGQNPTEIEVGAGLQKSKLGWEFFNGNPNNEDLSWIELGADGTNRMGSIFLFGASDTQMLDGAEAQSSYYKKIYFTRPLNEGFFEMWGPEIQMSIVNPTPQEVKLRCILNGSNGKAETTHTIPSFGFLAGDTAELISPDHGIVNGYLEVEVEEGLGVIGFSRIDFPDVRTALGMNAAHATASKTYYSAQLAHGMGIVTNLRLVNTGAVNHTVTLTAVGDTGALLAEPVEVEIAAQQIYSADLGTLFALEGEETISTGSLVVESDGHGIIGDIIFAEGDTMEYAMSLPLQDKLFIEAVFNHISNLPTVFTGFAFYNPGDETATVLIEAIGTDGQKVAEKTLILGPGERIARTLTDPDIWPDFPTQSGGYIKIQSTQPIAGQQLFGDKSLRYMAAIPPTTRLEPMFD